MAQGKLSEAQGTGQAYVMLTKQAILHDQLHNWQARMERWVKRDSQLLAF